jgi:hypothetical protein
MDEGVYLEPVENSPCIEELAFSRVLVGPGKDFAVGGSFGHFVEMCE